jgi:hypothetical protein
MRKVITSLVVTVIVALGLSSAKAGTIIIADLADDETQIVVFDDVPSDSNVWLSGYSLQVVPGPLRSCCLPWGSSDGSVFIVGDRPVSHRGSGSRWAAQIEYLTQITHAF